MTWLDNLKVGDYVFVDDRHGRILAKVDKITPTGRIVVNKTQYIDGENNINNAWFHSSLAEATPEAIEQYKKDNFIIRVANKMKSINRFDVTYEQAQEIVKIMNWRNINETL